MPIKKPPDEQPFSDSERASLSRMARDREREEWLRDRNRGRWERAKTWATWITAFLVLEKQLWPQLMELAVWLGLREK